MKTRFLILLFVASCLSTHAAAITIAQWTFETAPPPNLNNSATSPTALADVGRGTAVGVHNSAATDWSTPGGNGSANSFSANTWAAGDYWQFQVDTVGYEDISLSWSQTSSSTGPRSFGLFYSIDGTTYTQFDVNYAVGVLSWSAGTLQSGSVLSFDLSSVVGLNDAPSVYFQLRNMAGVAAGGTSRIDDFMVTGAEIAQTNVPESLPAWASFFLLLPFVARQLLFVLRRRTT